MTAPADIFRDSVNALLCNVHTSLPGIIVSYDAENNKATVQPALNKNFTSGEMPMPILESVPVMFPNNIVFPINEGDYVLLIFVERSIDLWLSVGGQVTPTDPRKFDLSDGIAIPGLMPFTQSYPNNNNQDYVINFGGSTITIKPDGAVIIKTASTVAIGNPIVELLDVVSQILSFIANPVGVSVPSVPFTGPLVDAATAAALKVQLDTIKGSIT